MSILTALEHLYTSKETGSTGNTGWGPANNLTPLTTYLKSNDTY